jgi:CHAT domain-containing protein
MLLEADSFYRKALDIFKDKAGLNLSNYNDILQQLSQIAYKKGKYKEAEKLMDEALENGKSYFELLPFMKFGCYNRSVPIFLAANQLKKAKYYQQEAAKFISKNFEPSDKIFLSNLRYAIQIADVEGNKNAVLGHTQGWLLGMEKLIERQITFLPDGDKTQFLEILNIQFADVVSVLTHTEKGKYLYPEGAEFLYNLALLQKGIALAETRGFQQKLSELSEGNIKNIAFQLVYRMKALNDDKTPLEIRTQFSHEADSLRTILKNDEKGKGLFTNEWIKTGYMDIQAKMQENEVAIEFLDFKDQKPTEPTEDIVYYAFVLKKTGNPIPILLFKEKSLQEIMNMDSVKKHNKHPSYYGSIDTLYQSALFGKKLTELIWQPLENAKILRGGETIYYAPTGLLHKVSFAALPTSKNEYLSKEYELIQMNSTRDIGTENDGLFNSKNTTVALFKDIKYDADSTEIMKYNKQFQDFLPHFKSVVRVTKPCKFESLDGVTQPIESILQSKQVKMDIFKGASATEDAARSYGKKGMPQAPTIFQFWTHGDYDIEKGSQYTTPQQSLNFNYMMMAGCERTLCRGESPLAPLTGMEDGFLTAAEISQMNLSTTQLVILSACQTGLGDIKGREGVYGLSRGFKLAGARYTLASLWSVPPDETAEYMICFYKKLFGGKTIPLAYAATQEEMRNKYKDAPHKWAAWVLTR